MQFSTMIFAVVAMFGATVAAAPAPDSSCAYDSYAACVAACEQGSAPTVCKTVRCGGCS